MKRDVVDAIESLLAHRTEDLGCYEFVLEAWMEEAASEIKRLRSERRWIPACERLPEQREDVLVFTQYGTHVAARNEYGEWYPSHGDGWQFPEPTHWMPLPDPPEVK